ncbi:2-C-methyl-D-erythritol 4-phosphate cytidylyltransferase, partial [Xanthomonas hyacinthi DSM 19077]
MDALWCVVPAAGRGVRAGGDRPKQYQSLAGRPLLDHTLERLAAHPRIAGLVVVIAADDPHFSAVESIGGKPLIATIGGGERSDSVLAGGTALPGAHAPEHFLPVHRAPRPLLGADDITPPIG